MNIYKYMKMYIYIYICFYICTYLYMHVYACICICVCMYMMYIYHLVSFMYPRRLVQIYIKYNFQLFLDTFLFQVILYIMLMLLHFRIAIKIWK